MAVPPPLSLYPASLDEAVIIQNALRDKMRIENDFDEIHTIAGIDASYDIQNNITYAFIVVMDRATLKPIHAVRAAAPVSFPYIPGFLSFREIPAILLAMDQLDQKPDLLMVDGQGIAHPRRMGIAAHLGVLMDLPAIGVAKSRLAGWNKDVGLQKGDQTPLIYKREQIGTVLRSKDNVKPLYISPGHRIDQDTAVAITTECLGRHRLPEPTRLADKISKTHKTSTMNFAQPALFALS